jgi:hypothetical protein
VRARITGESPSHRARMARAMLCFFTMDFLSL